MTKHGNNDNDDDKRDVKKLFEDAHDQGALSARSLAALDVIRS